MLLIASAFAVHGHATTGGMATSLLLVVHLACVAVWLGAFLPLHRLCRLATDDPAALLELRRQAGGLRRWAVLPWPCCFKRRYTGSVSDRISKAMVATDYGLALSGKVILVSGLLGLAALNRFGWCRQSTGENARLQRVLACQCAWKCSLRLP